MIRELLEETELCVAGEIIAVAPRGKTAVVVEANEGRDQYTVTVRRTKHRSVEAARVFAGSEVYGDEVPLRTPLR